MTKISWGKKIAILYITFVLVIITMVVISMNQKIDLVSKDYYEKELVFQNKIDEMSNANALSEKINHQILENGIEFQFPKQFINQNVNGNILFFKPSDASKDYAQDLKLNNEGKITIDSKVLSKGMYKVQISWKASNTDYFTEQIIVMP